jgi:hypothetical protein
MDILKNMDEKKLLELFNLKKNEFDTLKKKLEKIQKKIAEAKKDMDDIDKKLEDQKSEIFEIQMDKLIEKMKKDDNLYPIRVIFNKERSDKIKIEKNYVLEMFDKFDNADVILQEKPVYRNDGKSIMVQYESDGVYKRKLCRFSRWNDEYGTALPIKGMNELNEKIDHNLIYWMTIKQYIKKNKSTITKENLKNLKKTYKKYGDSVFMYWSDHEYGENDSNENSSRIHFLTELEDHLYMITMNLTNGNIKQCVDRYINYESTIDMTEEELEEYQNIFED